MNTRSSLAFCLVTLLGPVALAQTVTTDTNYAVFATDGVTTAFDGVAAGTAVVDELEVSARVRQTTQSSHHRRTLASASTDVEVGCRGVEIDEEGSVNTRGATGKFSAGTSADAPGTTLPTQGAHSIHLVIAAAAGTAGEVTIDWEAEQTTGATVTSSVDVNDDGVADFTGVGNVDQRVTIPVTAGTKGFMIHITTSGSASINGIGSESYEASLEIEVETSRFSFSPLGTECLGELTGSSTDDSSNARVNFTITGAAANGFAILAAGAPAAAPLPLPAGTCTMLVEPGTATLQVFLTDATGNATAQMRTRLRNTSIDVQVLTLGFVAGAIGTTNGLRVIIN
jgi:hypothetical protein